ncbi:MULTISPECIES: YraN family protein [Marinobacter]|uniref:YraN family protein n=1 Tax=Marinobacter TaxID=2742 RepID=UPI00222E44E9|nr:YraN family protein [Marinobacter sp. AN1]UZD66818.1 YraN family protein [Marinobacter sp. AN1]
MRARDGDTTPATGRVNRKKLGDQAEGVAARYLQSKGVRILERNVYNRGGEIDLIGQDAETLVFFEVRFRKRHALTDGAESIGWRKQQKLLRAVSFYLHRNGLWDHPCRIDVVAIAPGTTHQYRIRWIRNAIQAEA